MRMTVEQSKIHASHQERAVSLRVLLLLVELKLLRAENPKQIENLKAERAALTDMLFDAMLKCNGYRFEVADHCLYALGPFAFRSRHPYRARRSN